jgi:hypothetical protein
LATERDDLVQEGLPVAHTSLGCLYDICQCAIVDFDPFAIRDLAKVRLDFPGRDRSEDELLATGKDRCRNLMSFGRCHDEGNVRRRFLQDFEKRIEGGRGQHVDFIDDEDFVPAAGRSVFGAFPQLPDIVDAGVRGCIDLEDVYRFPEAISWHEGQTLHGVIVGPFSQLSPLARIRAVVVLPTPRGPENR